MKQLTFRIPSQVFLPAPYQLTERILLKPAQRVQMQAGNSMVVYLCSFFYVEADPPHNPCVPPEFPFSPSYENLRDFVTFWSFLEDNDWAIRAFEQDEGSPQYTDNVPAEEPSNWNNGIHEIDPDKVRILSGLHHSAKTFELKDLFKRFLNADLKLRDLIALERFEPNRYVADRCRQAYENHLMQSAFDWIIVDALSPAERCDGGSAKCPKCGKEDAKVSHVNRTFRQRMEEDLLKNFPDAAEYAEILH